MCLYKNATKLKFVHVLYRAEDHVFVYDDDMDLNLTEPDIDLNISHCQVSFINIYKGVINPLNMSRRGL